MLCIVPALSLIFLIILTANMAANAAKAKPTNSGDETISSVVIGVVAQLAIMENHLTCACAGSDTTIPAISNISFCFNLAPP